MIAALIAVELIIFWSVSPKRRTHIQRIDPDAIDPPEWFKELILANYTMIQEAMVFQGYPPAEVGYQYHILENGALRVTMRPPVWFRGQIRSLRLPPLAQRSRLNLTGYRRIY